MLVLSPVMIVAFAPVSLVRNWESYLKLCVPVVILAGCAWFFHDALLSALFSRLGNNALLPAAITAYFSICFTSAALARALGLWLESRGWRRSRTLFIDGVGVLLVFLVVLSPAAWIAFEDRSPATACLELRTPVRIEGLEMKLPRLPYIWVFLTNPERPEVRYGSNNRHQRDLCRRSKNGTSFVDAEAVKLSLAGRIESRSFSRKPSWCAESQHKWWRNLCVESSSREAGYLPKELTIYDEVFVSLIGGFAAETSYRVFSRSRFASPQVDRMAADELGGAVVRYADEYFLAIGKQYRHSDGSQLTARCKPHFRRNWLHCAVDFALRGKLRVSWSYDAPKAEAAQRLLKSDLIVRDILRDFGVRANR